jgi:hypothetical protein
MALISGLRAIKYSGVSADGKFPDDPPAGIAVGVACGTVPNPIPLGLEFVVRHTGTVRNSTSISGSGGIGRGVDVAVTDGAVGTALRVGTTSKSGTSVAVGEAAVKVACGTGLEGPGDITNFESSVPLEQPADTVSITIAVNMIACNKVNRFTVGPSQSRDTPDRADLALRQTHLIQRNGYRRNLQMRYWIYRPSLCKKTSDLYFA